MSQSTTADQDDLANLVALLKLASLINRPMLEEVAEPAGLSLNDLRVLMSLAGEGSAAAHDLSELMGMHPMSVSRSVSILRETGTIDEVRDRENRRRKLLSLTEAGETRHRDLLPQAQQVALRLFAALSAGERRAAAGILAKLIKRLEAWPAQKAAE